MTREHDDAMDRLNRLGDPEPEPILIVPATPERGFDEPPPSPTPPPPTMPMPPQAQDTGSDAFAPTVAQQVGAHRPSHLVVEPVAMAAPVASVYEPPPRSGMWPTIIAAVIALALGGIIGFLIGNASDDVESTVSGTSTLPPPVSGAIDPATIDQATVDQRVNDVLTLLVAQAEQNGSVVTPTPYPKLDQLLAIAAADDPATPDDAQTNIDELTAERDQLANQVTTLEDQLATAEGERDALQATLDSSDSNSAARITGLENQVETLTADLDAARADLQTVQRDLDTANATLSELNVQELPNLSNVDIEEVRRLAASNGWQLIEATSTNTSGAANRVTAQQPAAGANMIAGSVLYVEVTKPK